MNLLDIQDTSLVSKTNLSRKITLGGVTKAYPVYRVHLDLMYYNDQNDRIATWITQYKNDNTKTNLEDLNKEDFNLIIENFIINSNPDAISKTKNNIALVNQREPGVVLNDGRVIDGNRRFTCLRLLNRENQEFNYFETIILEASNEKDKKQIKMLELAIQHGEEQRVGYNLIDLAVGAYHDIVETKLLTIEEYASSTNESLGEVRKRLDVAVLINELLEFMNVPLQYHIAREMAVYSILAEFSPLLKKMTSEEEIKDIKESVFSNIMMQSFDDNRKYIRNIKSMVDSGFFSTYMKEQKRIANQLNAKKQAAAITNKKDLQRFVQENDDIAEDLQISMSRTLLQTKKEQTKNKPAQIVNKSISMLMDIDTNIIDKLSDSEKDKLKNQLSKLTNAISIIEDEFDNLDEEQEVSEPVSKNPFVSVRRKNEPYIYCIDENNAITNLAFSLSFQAFKFNDRQDDSVECMIGFVNNEFEELCPMKTIKIHVDKPVKVDFSLNSSSSNLNECYLVIKSLSDSYNVIQQKIPFNISMAFTVDFDF